MPDIADIPLEFATESFLVGSVSAACHPEGCELNLLLASDLQGMTDIQARLARALDPRGILWRHLPLRPVTSCNHEPK